MRLDAPPKRTVLLDVDGTLCDNLSRLTDYIGSAYGVELSPATITDWSFSVPETDAHIGEIIEHVTSERPEWFLLGMEPIEGARAAAEWIAEHGHTIAIATHRPAETHPLTRQWLAEHDIPYDVLIEDVPRNKGNLEGDLLIDDYHVNVANALAAGKAAGLFVQPYSDPTACSAALTAGDWTTMCAKLGREGVDDADIGSVVDAETASVDNADTASVDDADTASSGDADIGSVNDTDIDFINDTDTAPGGDPP